MTLRTLLKDYNHFTRLVEDKAFRDSFCMSIERDGAKLNSVKSELVAKDAKGALERLLDKQKNNKAFQEAISQKPKVEVKETKSKGKK